MFQVIYTHVCQVSKRWEVLRRSNPLIRDVEDCVLGRSEVSYFRWRRGEDVGCNFEIKERFQIHEVKEKN